VTGDNDPVTVLDTLKQYTKNVKSESFEDAKGQQKKKFSSTGNRTLVSRARYYDDKRKLYMLIIKSYGEDKGETYS